MKTKYIIERLVNGTWKNDSEFFNLEFAQSFERLLRSMGHKVMIKVERVK